MRRTRLIFIFASLFFLTVVFVVHQHRQGAFGDVYSGNWSRPNFNLPDWMKSPSLDSITGLEKTGDSDTYVGGYPGHTDESTLTATEPAKEETVEEDLTPGLAPIKLGDEAAAEIKWPFQLDLDIPIPETDLTQFKAYSPHHWDPNGPKTYAYATFMSTRNPSIRDPYFMAVQNVLYRVLWAQKSKSAKYPFIAFVGHWVTQEQRDILAGMGAIVRELSPLEWKPNVPGVQSRWADLFAKLNMWNSTDFSRIMFLDADAFPMTNIDDVFELVAPVPCKTEKMSKDDYLSDGSATCSSATEDFVFAGVPQDRDPNHPLHPNINVGGIVFTPDKVQHDRLVQNYVKTDKYDCLMAEQSFLNWQFHPTGAFPSTMIDRTWNGFFPQVDEEGKLNVVHEKMWSSLYNHAWLVEEWKNSWAAQLAWFDSPDFRAARVLDGKV